MKVISPKNLPTKIPVSFTAILFLIMDKYNAAGWVWGLVGGVMALLWIGCIITISKEERMEIDVKDIKE